MGSAREQIKILRKKYPNWTKTDIARAVIPPVSPQRVGAIENNVKQNFRSEKYRLRNRHKYHNKIEKKFKNCSLCNVKLPIDNRVKVVYT